MKIVKLLCRFNLITLYINFKYFKIRDAIKFPVLVFGKVSVHDLKGQMVIVGPVKTGMITFGKIELGIFERSVKTVFDVKGLIEFNGAARFGKGTKISVGELSRVVLGDNFKVSGNSAIVSTDGKTVMFGNNCLLSWDVLIMNSDFHDVYSLSTHQVINAPKDVIIGDHVWLGSRSVVLKGSAIPNNCVIASNSTVLGVLEQPDSIYAGSPAKFIKNQIGWHS